ncbi:hypothetical protein BD779DRAFT_1464510, partial [Infundibulicybe gibba]
ISFVQQPLPDGSHSGAGGLNGQFGVLGLGQHASTATQLKLIPDFRCYITLLIGTWIADTYLH